MKLTFGLALLVAATNAIRYNTLVSFRHPKIADKPLTKQYDGQRFEGAFSIVLPPPEGPPVPTTFYFNGIYYGDEWSIVNLEDSALSHQLHPNSAPNVTLVTGNVGKPLGRWGPVEALTRFDYTSVAVACVAVVAGEPVSVGCTVRCDGSRYQDSMYHKSALVNAPVNKLYGQMTVANLTPIHGVDFLDFTVTNITSTNANVETVSLLVDTARYQMRKIHS